MTFTIPLVHSIKGREADINLGMKFNSGLNWPDGRFGHFWEGSWQKILVVEFVDEVTDAECADSAALPRSADMPTWLNAIRSITEHNAERGTRVWTNRDAIEGRWAFSSVPPIIGVPAGNLSGEAQIKPPDYDDRDSYEMILMECNGKSIYQMGATILEAGLPGSSMIGDLVAAEQRTTVVEFVPPLGVFDKMHFECDDDEVQIRRPDGSIDVFAGFRVRNEHDICEAGGEMPPGVAATLRVQAIAPILRTEYPNGDIIEYVYDEDTHGKLIGIRDNFGRDAIEFEYYPDSPRLMRIRTQVPGFTTQVTEFAYRIQDGTELLATISNPSTGRAWNFHYGLRVLNVPVKEVRAEFSDLHLSEWVKIFAPENPYDPLDPNGLGSLPLVQADFHIPNNLPDPMPEYQVTNYVEDLWIGNSWAGGSWGDYLESVGGANYTFNTGKHVHYSRSGNSGCQSNLTVTATDSLGLTTVQEFDWQGRELSRTESFLENGASVSRTTTYTYHDLYSTVKKTTYPNGNWVHEISQFMLDDGYDPNAQDPNDPNSIGTQLSYFDYEEDPNEVARDRFQGGNVRLVRRGGPNTSEVEEIERRWTYEPLLNQVLSEVDGRGFQTKYFFDYQEGTGPPAEFAEWNLDSSSVVFFDKELNDDGTTTQTIGRSIGARYPDVTLGILPPNVGPQVGSEASAFDDYGQMIWSLDPGGYYTSYEYYGAPGGGAGPGYLRSKTVDDAPPSNPGATGHLKIKTEYGYDDLGRKLWEKDPRPGDFHQVWEYDIYNRVEREIAGDVDALGVFRSSDFVETEFDYDENDNLIEARERNDDSAFAALPQTNPGWVTYRYGYDMLDQLRLEESELITPPEPNESPTLRFLQTFYHYDDNGNVTKHVSPAGRAVSQVYDPVGRVRQKRTHLLYDPSPSTPLIPGADPNDPNGDPILEFSYDDNDNLEAVDVWRDAFGTKSTTSFLYDDFDRRIAKLQPERMSTHHEFDKNDNIVRVYAKGPRDHLDLTEGVLSEGDFFYDERDRLYQVESEFFTWVNNGGQWTQVALGGSGLITTKIEHDERSLPQKTVDARGFETVSVYDGAGRKESTTLPETDPLLGSNYQTNTYDEAGNVVIEWSHEVGFDTSGTAQTEVYRVERDYDALSRKTEERVYPKEGIANPPPALVSRWEYSSRGDAIGTWNPRGYGARAFYDTLHREVTKEFGYVYPDFDEVVGAVGDPNDGINDDGFIRVGSVFDDDGNIELRVDDNGNPTIYRFDAAGRQYEVALADMSYEATEYSRDGTINVERKFSDTNEEIFNVVYGYDAALRKTSAHFNLNTEDPDASLSGVLMERFGYDGRSRISYSRAISEIPDPANPMSAQSTLTKKYDSSGNLLSDLQQLGIGDPNDPNDPNEFVLWFEEDVLCQYDESGNRTNVTADSGLYDVDYLFDELNRIESIVRPSVGPNSLHSMEYLGSGLRLRRRENLNGASCEIGVDRYDPFKRLEQIVSKDGGGTTIQDFTYSYDESGNVLSETKGHRIDRSHEYDFDAADRVVAYRAGEPPFATLTDEQTYGLDGVGNWLEHTNAPGQAPFQHTVNELNEYELNQYGIGFGESAVDYDDRGNLTIYGSDSYGYDARERIVRATANGQDTYYAFDAEGRRILAGGWLAVHEKGREIRHRKTWNPNQRKEFVYGAGIDEILSFTDDGVAFYVHQNRLGSTTGVTDSAGVLVDEYDYSPYGIHTPFDVDQSGYVDFPFLFAGRRHDEESGLYYMRARYYHPEMGRFTARDPIGIWGDGGNWGNGYGYGWMNPLGVVDPAGTHGFGRTMNRLLGITNDVKAAATTVSREAVNAAGAISVAGNDARAQILTFGTVSRDTSPVNSMLRSATNAESHALYTPVNTATNMVGGAALTVATGGAYAVVDTTVTVGRASTDVVGGARQGDIARVLGGFFQLGVEAVTNSRQVGEVAGEVGERVGRNLSGTCFVAGTLVYARRGSIPIEEIEVGDVVLAWNEEAGDLAAREVTETYRGFTYYWVDVSLDGEVIAATRGHRFWVESRQGWIAAIDLAPGMLLRCSTGEIKEIRNVRVRELQTAEETFNLEVKDLHNFFVGNSEVLVHNGDFEPKEGRDTGPNQSRRAALREAKRQSGVPTSQSHESHDSNVRDKTNPGKTVTEYKFKDSDGKPVTIPDHKNGHPVGNVPKHFNDTKGGHHLYGGGC